MRYRRKVIDDYLDTVAIYLCFGAINGWFIYHETLLCEMVSPFSRNN
jgi:hypothetical protein